jgi:hypothetical protein
MATSLSRLRAATIGILHLTMKLVSFLLLAICASSSVFAADWSKVPYVRMPRGAESDFDFVKKNMAELHPWKSGMALPGNFKDVGLEQPVRLVKCSLYFDLGSLCYVFRGSNDKFLVICTDAPEYGAPNDKKILKRESATLYLGVWHNSDKTGTAVAADSKTELFLLAAIQAEAERINGSSKSKTSATGP